MQRRGFTLIELLVVIIIIAVLVMILLPVFQRPRHSGHRSSCQSNLKQIGLGILQYTQDFDERYPLVRVANSSGA
jgi:prepilin-type N-terminal cleavage/methylation domain-containing protein